MKKSARPLAVSMGDPAGIGPEVIVKALDLLPGLTVIIAGDPAVMDLAFSRWASPALRRAWRNKPLHQKPKDAVTPGILVTSRLDPRKLRPGRPAAREGKAAAAAMEAALELVANTTCRALVTAPVSKAALKAGGFPFPGHTDWLAERTRTRSVMMLTAGTLRVVALTAHLPLKQVPRAVTRKLILETIAVVDRDLRTRFRVKTPRLAVAGLNPHAGEAGVLGTEEIEIIIPALEQARRQGFTVSGPHPADTMFTVAGRRAFDAAICMYHDQAMLPVKTIGMHRAVNVTLGLPLVRTSPAHGTAPDIAGQGKADPRSMAEALKLAARLARA